MVKDEQPGLGGVFKADGPATVHGAEECKVVGLFVSLGRFGLGADVEDGFPCLACAGGW
jgi:hypothetical protein